MALLGFIGFLSMSSQRMCITVALICMLNQTAMTADHRTPLTPKPTPTPGVTVTAAELQTNGSTVGGNNVTAAERGVGAGVTQPPAKTCGHIPEIFVLNTSDFSRVNVSRVFTVFCCKRTLTGSAAPAPLGNTLVTVIIVFIRTRK